eukprot:Nitzschia sp. Nitz4//scaffold148_size54725//30399//31130//NITZ4_006659-RA/size54725-processed-gene-0.14-mRNA-1//1//CDS//3329536751//3863//frame0
MSRPLGIKLMSEDDATTQVWRRSTVEHIEEAIDLTWKDPFYDDQPDIIAVFDFPDEDQVAAWFWRQSLPTAMFHSCLGAAFIGLSFFEGNGGNGEEGNPNVLLYVGVFEMVIWMIYLVNRYTMNRTCQRAAKEKWQHLAVTTQGVWVDDTSRNLSLRIPFANIQSVEIGFIHAHLGEFPISCPHPVVKLACDRLPSERTLWSTLSCTNKTICYATNIEKQKEFVSLVLAMKKREEADRMEALC